jgi:hypothetical protein
LVAPGKLARANSAESRTSITRSAGSLSIRARKI